MPKGVKRHGPDAHFTGLPNMGWNNFPPPRPVRIKQPWNCYVCADPIEVGAWGFWSKRRKGWRHADCVVPPPTTAP